MSLPSAMSHTPAATAAADPLDEPPGVGRIGVVPEQRHITIQEAIEFRLQVQQLSLVHELLQQKFPIRTAKLILYPIPASRRRSSWTAL